jgi:hypothetical protein
MTVGIENEGHDSSQKQPTNTKQVSCRKENNPTQQGSIEGEGGGDHGAAHHQEGDHHMEGNKAGAVGGTGDTDTHQRNNNHNNHQHHLHQHNHHHANHHHHHRHRSLSDQMPWYTPPMQRQRWDEEQLTPHTEWGDIFFDLFYVASACK